MDGSENDQKRGPECNVVVLRHLLQALWAIKKVSMKRKMRSEKKYSEGHSVIRTLADRNIVSSPWSMKRHTTGIWKNSAGLRRRSVARRYYNSSCKPRVMGKSIYTRLKKLQKLIPGGRNMAVDVLFQETADYILSLKMQVYVLQALSNAYTTNPALHS
eukprot:Gb_41387 [translate_table: standard]